MKKPDENGNGGVPIKKVRIFAHKSTALELKEHTFKSDKEYKNKYYVDSGDGSNYELRVYERGLVINNLFEFAKGIDKTITNKDLGKELGVVNPGLTTLIVCKDKNVHLFDNMPEKEVVNRMFVIYKFKLINGVYPRIHCRKATEARSEKMIPEAERCISDFDEGYKLPHFYIGESDFLSHLLIEGIDYNLSLGGSINFL